MTDAAPLPPSLDLTACEREPIHLLGSIQPHGVLLALQGPELTVRHASANAVQLGGPNAPVLNAPLTEVFPSLAAQVGPWLGSAVERQEATYLGSVTLETARGRQSFDVAAHRMNALTILELEEVTRTDGTVTSFDALQPRLNDLVDRLHDAASVDEVCGLVAREVRHVTGFDRVLIYRFDQTWNGTVIAEDRNEVLPSYLGLRFPASDIPAQARDLYRRNRLRIIPDAGYVPVSIRSPEGAGPLDLSQSILRSVSPVHVEYMHNMGTLSSMSISILVDGVLWGLVSCHSQAPRRVPLQTRNACDFLARVFGLQLAARERSTQAEERVRLGAIQARLLTAMAEEEQFVDGLSRNPDAVLGLTGAASAAVVSDEACMVIGTPIPERDVRRVFTWLSAAHGGREVFATDNLSAEFPEAADLADVASGLLAISISKKYDSYVLWFRPEVVQTVRWGGDPSKPVIPDAGPVRLHPRKSFEIWKETLKGHSLPWSPAEIEAVKELRNGILGIVLRRAEELASLSEELKRSNKELEAFSYSVSHDLRAPFRHIIGYSELLRAREGDRLSDTGRRYVETIIEAALSAGTLVDNLLSFSQMGRNSLRPVECDLGALLEEVRRKTLRDLPPERVIRWTVGPLGKAYADPVMLRLVLENLLSNAIKYTRHRPEAIIEIGRLEDRDGEAGFFIRDNGVGFDMAYVNKLFGVFQRLHRVEEFEGTGIGLANVRRIIERHGGRTWAEGQVNRGATFYFTLPRQQEGSHGG
ncbi:ATP-binding protein [Roseomonas chloroacetimidivorans]|uniref:ATP-binding protein n=1 Tax=Roseomonas chloroacetimidivorans TaxID=1766656 RepID=UPI003C707CE2